MPRPQCEPHRPLEVLKILWEHEPSMVRDVMDVLNRSRRRTYTSVMGLLGVMMDKDARSTRARRRAGRAVRPRSGTVSWLLMTTDPL